MKLFKSLLLASATGLVAVSGASAADLGAKKPSPVEYVRACYNPLWGTSGGFVIPGTQTCLRVFGQARFDYGYVEPFVRTNSPSGFRGGAIVGLDAITPSEYGNVRAFAQVGMIYRTGNQRTGTGTRQGTFVDGFNGGTGGTGIGSFGGSIGGTEMVFSGFIQFAGFTMGRTASFFDPFFTPEIIGTTFRSAPGNVNLIAYTAVLGNGLTASISLEDPTVRRQAVLNGTPARTFEEVFILRGRDGVVVSDGFQFSNRNLIQRGIRMPEIVGAIQLDQAWGSAKLAGVFREVTVAQALDGLGANAGVQNVLPNAKYGFAVMGALKVNLPMIAAGDNFVVTGAYGEGALNYVTSNFFGGTTSQQGIGNVTYATGDAVVDRFAGNMKLVKAWSVAAGFQHFWTPTISSTVFGSFAQVDTPRTQQVANLPGLGTLDTVRDARFWSVGLNTVWQPVRGLNVALEGAYTAIDVKGRVINSANIANNPGGAAFGVDCRVVACGTTGGDGFFQARLRVTRDF